YLGPKDSAEKIRTLVALRTQELADAQLRVAKQRRTDLLHPDTVRWDDLATPAEILRQLALQHCWQVAGIQVVPHVLWAKAVLPDASPIEALSLVLIQFDLTFAWTTGGEGIQLTPVPKSVAIERTYTPPKMSAVEAAQRWREAIPGLIAESRGGKV